VGRRRLLYGWTALFAVIGVAGLVDFWLWAYDYGHHLDEASAIIKIPGMAYQPPLIGSKQLLNFTATSWPDVGGIAATLAFLCAVAAVLLTMRSSRGAARRTAAATLTLVASACASSEPRPIQYGTAECEQCHMIVSDERYAARLVTSTGKTHDFDSVECLARWYLTRRDSVKVRALQVSDVQHPGTLVPAERARFVRSGTRHSPMGLGLMAFAADADPVELARTFSGEVLDWPGVLALVARETPRQGMAGSLPHQHAHDAIAAVVDAARR
ncbi:MAG TPA: nitrous oxide reductase accessory protein NosL, partial [Gemmatimonadaceae bacterium]|nr:nitrous oxide reductase accessory protein NosL [Gemmatimonadaceae bacterium]